MLGCQVSVHDFVAALDVLTSALVIKDRKCNIYPAMIDCFEEYRYMKNELRHLRSLVPDRQHDGTQCPACLKDGEVYLSIDGNFGLCRKKSSGSSVRAPLHSDSVFLDQEDIDKFVNSYGSLEVHHNKECNQFLAGHALRSSGRYKALDETGLVGIVCRHEVPHSILIEAWGTTLVYCLCPREDNGGQSTP